jgi:N-acetylglutamate synthase-like GNAT family acetyltransferase
MTTIRVATHHDFPVLAMLVSEANKDVARKFGLDAGNCPKHPSFYTQAWVEADFARGERYFVLDDGAVPAGCVAYESPRPGVAYLNRLSVLPAHRQRGAGSKLVRHVIAHARASAIETISIGVIGEHTELQRWYSRLGFASGETRRFPHLPFSVKYMRYALQG